MVGRHAKNLYFSITYFKQGDINMNNQEFFDIKIAGLQRQLPLCVVSDKLKIAAFIMFGDVEITEKCACELLKKCPEFDFLLTAESKGIPLGYEMAKQSGKNYIVARKSEKLYMKKPISVEVKSITTEKMQKLYLSEDDLVKMEGKRILLVDDVISTGKSLAALEELISKANGTIVGKACVLAEGNASERKDIIFLEKLPVFPIE